MRDSLVEPQLQTKAINGYLSSEPFVDAQRAAIFLSMSRKTVLALARRNQLPAHPIGGLRKIWRFRISELEHWLNTEVNSDSHRGRVERSFS
jgi:predicted DNA-binding transcriptional regulator AlpA